MQRLIFYTVYIFMTFGCIDSRRQKGIVVEGDLYFSLSIMPNFYGLPDSVAERAEKILDTIKVQHLDLVDSAIFSKYKILKSKDLLYKPYILLKLDNDSVITVLLEKAAYKRIAPTDYLKLIKDRIKLRVKAKVEPLQGSIYYGLSIIDMDTVRGQTREHYLKFRPSDYL